MRLGVVLHLADLGLEEATEGGGIVEAEIVRDLFGAPVGVSQLALRLEGDPLADQLEWATLPGAGEQVGERLRRPMQHPRVVLHAVVPPVVLLDEQVEPAHDVELRRVERPGNVGRACQPR